MPLSLDSVRALCNRHQEKLIDAILLLVALNLTSVIPGLVIFSTGAQVALLAVFALFAAPKVEANEGIWRRYRKLMPSYLGTAVAGGLFVGWWFALPRPLWWFAPLWLALTLARRLVTLLLGWEPLVSACTRSRWEIVAGDLLLLVHFTFLVRAWSDAPGPTWLAVLGLAAAWAALNGFLSWHQPDSPRHVAGRWAAVSLLPLGWAGLALAGGGTGAVPWVFSGWLALALLLYRLAVRRWASLADGPAEILRWITLWLAVAFYFYPFARAGVHGAGDAFYYATFLADAVEQFRHGVFPVYVGQSEYQFNGSIVPIRVAPGFQYFGGLADLLTARTLGPAALQNLAVTLSAFAAAFAVYTAARRQLAGWTAWALAGLFITCPGVMAILFVNDLYMSWLAVPLVPVAFALCFATFSATGARLYAVLGFVLGLTWWIHAPIALWLTMVLSLLQVVRFIRQRPPARILASELAAGAFVFILTAAYPLVSSALYPADPAAGGASGGFTVPAANILQQLLENFPAAWLPISPNGRALSDFQLGYGLVAITAIAVWRARRWELRVLVAIMIGLVLLLIPVSGITLRLWELIPNAVRAITNIWVMQRLFLVLAASAIFLAIEAWTPHPGRPTPTVRWILFAACLWSGLEGLKFIRGSHAAREADIGRPTRLVPENIVLTRFSYGFFPTKPAYFTHGATDPALENRLLDEDLRTVVVSNYDTAARQGGASATFPFILINGRLEVAPQPVLQPGRRYLATPWAAGNPRLEGALVLNGPSLLRVYGLPNYGESRSFGLTPGRNPSFPLHTSSATPERLRVLFEPVNPAVLPVSAGQMQLKLTEYLPAALPIRVESWIPYRARVTAERSLWLETPRAHQAGYAATINGKPAEVLRSGEGLVSVPVPAGESVVEIRYVPPAGLRMAFWLSFTMILLGVTAIIVGGCRTLARPVGLPVPR